MHPSLLYPRNPTAFAHERELAACFASAVTHSLPIVLWRPPACSASQAIVDLSGAAQPAAVDFHLQEPRFVFSPFLSDDRHPTLCIRADLHLTAAGLTARRELWNGQRRQWEEFLATYQARRASATHTQPAWYGPSDRSPSHCSTYVEYCDLVRRAIDFIEASGLEKVVVSRTAEVALPAGFDPVTIFQRLCWRYPDAFVSLVALPGVGTWIGASPELLLNVDQHSLSTMALAGTQARPAGLSLSALRWSPKELAEQALVSAYIRQFFKQAGVAALQETGPETVAAGNVAHLQSSFHVKLPRNQRMALANRVLHELHPTSAVCGMPKDKALAFILQQECYDRSFYSGYLGPLHIDGQSSLYVNLRCMQLRQTTANLYVGGGVTDDSQPEAEWRETELKAETLLAALRPQVDCLASLPAALPLAL